jgi:acetoin utilization protein AcuB
MFVKQVMTSPVTTVESLHFIAYADDLLREGRFRHLPVVRDGILVGIVSDRDVTLSRRTGGVRALLTVESIMQQHVVTVTAETTVEEASRLMVVNKIGALPVMDDGRLVGIVSQMDLLRTLTRLLGVTESSTPLRLELTEPPHQLAIVTRLADEHGVRILSLVTEPLNDPRRQTVVLRVGTPAPDRFFHDLQEAGIRALEPVAV